MFLPKVITVDGPAASGKSTVGRLLAYKLGYTFLDSGILYRVVAQNVINYGVEPENESDVIRLSELLGFEIKPACNSTDPSPMIFILGNEVDEKALHTSEIDKIVPIVAKYRGIRQLIRTFQMTIAAQGQIVMAGRDIGTVVLPDADLKVYLTVSVEERARRRYSDVLKLGVNQTVDEILQQLKQRDELDENRNISPMKPAVDAIIIEADGFTPNDIVDKIIKCFQS
jgi:cytidylate kinase